MVSPLVLLFLLLHFCVEDTSASTVSLTRITSNGLSDGPKDIENTIESNPTTILFSVTTTELPKDDENSTPGYSEKNETLSEKNADMSNVTDIPFLTNPVNEELNENSGSPETPDVTTSNDSDPTESAKPIKETVDSTSTTTIESGLPDSTDFIPGSTTDSTEDTTSDFIPDSTDFIPGSTPDSTEDTTSDFIPDSTDFIPGSTPESTEDTTSAFIPDSTEDVSDFIPNSTEDVSDVTPESTESSTAPDDTTTSSITTTITTETTTTQTTSEETTPEETPPPDKGRTSPGIIAAIIVSILLIGIGITLLIAYRRGKLRWPHQNLFSSGLMDPIRPQPVTLKKFPAHCTDMLNVPSKLSHEYQLLATLSVDIYSTESFVAGQLPDNKSKNRYVNILPYDSTRVKLAPEGDDFYSDYVNASYIKGYTNEIEYIATQGPKEDTCRDFWKMVYQEPIKVIIMVTQLEEQGKPKCYKYFPNLRENLEFEDIIVRCTTELHFPIYTSRTLILTKGERKRSIIHLHFREWPDFGCPATPDLMLQFCQVMRHNIVLAQPGITLIHCSAGVGRTGTLIAVDILLQHIKENKKIDIFGTVYKLRKHRMNMVQSEAQYVYIYKCIKEALEDPSYLSSENSSTTSLEPIYENIECTRLSTVSSKIIPDTVVKENECAL